ncbi:MAG: hypothetical protein UT66_C0012G0008 [candidate division CPR2 bacterium GW2011_GWC1_39_9]|uniref:Uncharacterized protein n=1 Tax=candidate division CPR2 bacterium GW2011_GWC2_39_10 TaxID=1618345 RepID=A0A0G0PZB8_UNCC2|nr:MAG: hypothetical protein UT18_C0007G0002 [candidate division CPR2 bacterium GW2011_GWC2_39_10]KKR35167.1 MAG: hypothetical protein UT66_C0012G0008 [candidate division CPR2 bacterium GW2011_GWC1_39_9]
MPVNLRNGVSTVKIAGNSGRNVRIKVSDMQFEMFRRMYLRLTKDSAYKSESLSKLQLELGMSDNNFRWLINALHDKRLINKIDDRYELNHKKLKEVEFILASKSRGSRKPTGKKWIGETGEFVKE